MKIADTYICPVCYLGLAVIQVPINECKDAPHCCGKAMDKMWEGHENVDGTPNELVGRLRK